MGATVNRHVVPEDYIDVLEAHRGGLDFENCVRNQAIMKKMESTVPKTLKTGTTICGVVFDGGVALAADTRSTSGMMVADKNCQKLHKMANTVWCAGAGTAADLDLTTRFIESDLELLRLSTGTEPRVCTAAQRLTSKLFRYQGHIGCALVLGGVDFTGPHLYQIYPHGSSDQLPFASMGSGSLAAMSVIESGYKDKMTRDEAVDLVIGAIEAGIFNDLGSGSNVDVVVLTSGKHQLLRNVRTYNKRIVPKSKKNIPKMELSAPKVIAEFGKK